MSRVSRLGDVDARNQIGPQQIGQRSGVDLIGLDLGLGDDPRLKRVGQHDVLGGHHLLENLVEPVPVHARFEDDPAPRPPLDEPPKISADRVLDAPLAEHLAVAINHAIDAVSLVIIDANEARFRR